MAGRPPLVDSHCHLNYLEDPDQRLADARARGIAGFLCISVDAGGIDDVLALADAHPDVWATVGQHPDSAASDPEWIHPRLAHPKVVAAGEMGVDYFHERDPEIRRLQLERFDYQLSLASRHGLPVVIHTRSAERETLDRLRAHDGVVGVLHCFTESWALASAAVDLGYYVSISGIVTFKNGDNVRDVARRLPEDRLLLETDSPWLAPVPHRGSLNQPLYLTEIAALVAELRGVSLDSLAETTTANFRGLFGVGPA